MKIKQGRGRKAKYDFSPLKKQGDAVAIEVQYLEDRRSVWACAYNFAKSRGFSVKTETICNDDKCVLVIERL